MVDIMVGDISSALPSSLNRILIQQANTIAGYAPVGSIVTATVYIGHSGVPRGVGTYPTKAEPPYGWFMISGVEMAPGDRVVVDYQDGASTDMYNVYLSQFLLFRRWHGNERDTDADVDMRVSFLKWEVDSYTYYKSQPNSGSGNFVISLPDGGVTPDTRVDVAIMDDEGNGNYMITGRKYLEVLFSPGWDMDCVMGRVDLPNAPLTLILWRDGTPYYRHPSRPIWSDAGNQAPGGGYCFALWQDEDGDGYPETAMNYQVGDIIQLSTDTWDSYVTIRDIGWGVDAGNNTIDGQIFSGQTGEVSVRLYQSDNTLFSHSPIAEARTDADPNYTLQFDNFDVRAGIYVETYFYDENGFANHYTEQIIISRSIMIGLFGGTTLPQVRRSP